MKPAIERYPIEVFGTVYNDNSKQAILQREQQFCPFIGRQCNKPRKSEPEVKVGICSLGYKNFDNDFEPMIICPNRFLEGIVFDTIKQKFFPTWKPEQTKWIKGVNLGVGGNMDFVASKISENNDSVEDFLCVEFQANGTTGSPYGYVKDLISNGCYSEKYTYGLNWANEFMKTMMQQVYKKGNIVAHWGRKIVFVIQDTAMEYLYHTVDTSELRECMEDPIHFFTYKIIWNDEKCKFELCHSGWKSADLHGINTILAGANLEKYLTPEDFISNIEAKGKADGILNNDRN